jgi:hypothetical protein
MVEGGGLEMKRMILLLSLMLFFVSPVYAETCVTIKPGIAIDNIDDYKNMIFTSLAGDEATAELAMALMKQGKCIFLGKGEKIDVVAQSPEVAGFRRSGKGWFIPKSVIRCK